MEHRSGGGKVNSSFQCARALPCFHGHLLFHAALHTTHIDTYSKWDRWPAGTTALTSSEASYCRVFCFMQLPTAKLLLLLLPGAWIWGVWKERAEVLHQDDLLQNCSGIYTLCFLRGKKSAFSDDASLFPTGNAAEWISCHTVCTQSCNRLLMIKHKIPPELEVLIQHRGSSKTLTACSL